MAGIGPPPKDPSKRTRRNKETKQVTSLGEFKTAAQPDLPESIDWHPRTIEWWQTWGRAPQASNFTETDWSYLLDTALMHHEMWTKGSFNLAGEVRLRVAAFGATPADRARLRMQFADADEKDDRRNRRMSESQTRQKWGPLKAVE